MTKSNTNIKLKTTDCKHHYFWDGCYLYCGLNGTDFKSCKYSDDITKCPHHILED